MAKTTLTMTGIQLATRKPAVHTIMNDDVIRMFRTLISHLVSHDGMVSSDSRNLSSFRLLCMNVVYIVFNVHVSHDTSFNHEKLL